MRNCGKPGLSWLDVKVFEWLERNARDSDETGLARRAGAQLSRRSSLIFLAGCVACLASFVQVDASKGKAPEAVREHRFENVNGIVLAKR